MKWSHEVIIKIMSKHFIMIIIVINAMRLLIGHGNLKVINFASMQRQCITVNRQKLNLLVNFVEKLYAKLPCQDT